MSLRPCLVTSTLSARVLNVYEAKTVLLLVQNGERVCVFRSGKPPSLCIQTLTSCDKMDQAFPLHFCKLQAVKNYIRW